MSWEKNNNRLYHPTRLRTLSALLSVILLSACAQNAFQGPLLNKLLVPQFKNASRGVTRKAITTYHNQLHSNYLSIPVFSCIPQNGQAVNNNQSADWINSGDPIGIVAVTLWAGAASPGGANPSTLGGVLDLPYIAYNTTSGDIYIWGNQDRYANAPAMLGDLLTLDWAPDYFIVMTGDDIRFTVGCAGPYFDGNPVSVQGLFVWQYITYLQ